MGQQLDRHYRNTSAAATDTFSIGGFVFNVTITGEDQGQGCGTKKSDKTFGDPIFLDVFVKP